MNVMRVSWNYPEGLLGTEPQSHRRYCCYHRFLLLREAAPRRPLDRSIAMAVRLLPGGGRVGKGVGRSVFHEQLRLRE